MWELEHFDLLEPEANLLQSKQREIHGQRQPEHKNYMEATHLRLHVKDQMGAMYVPPTQPSESLEEVNGGPLGWAPENDGRKKVGA